MVSIVLASHGDLAEGLKMTGSMVFGDQPNVATVSLMPSMGPDDFRQKVEEAVASFDDPEDVLFLVDLWGGTPFNQISGLFDAHPSWAILTGVNLPMLVEEFMRAGISVDFKRRRFVDVQNIFHKMEQRTLVAAYKFYCDKDLTNAHSAEADTLATYEVLKAQLDRYDNLENDIDFLAEFSTRNESADYAGRILYNEKGEEVFGFGKYKGRCVAEIFESEPSYYNWMMNGDFPLYTKKVITEIRLRGSKEKKR